MTTCVLTPYQLAFGNDYNIDFTMFGIDQALNLCFLIDIYMNFTSAYYDDDYTLIEERSVSLLLLNSNLDHRKIIPLVLVHN